VAITNVAKALRGTMKMGDILNSHNEQILLEMGEGSSEVRFI